MGVNKLWEGLLIALNFIEWEKHRICLGKLITGGFLIVSLTLELTNKFNALCIRMFHISRTLLKTCSLHKIMF